MTLKERFIMKSLAGGLAGVFVGVAIASLCGGLPAGCPLMVQLFLYALMGVVGNGGSIVYEIESWSLTKATLLHYLFTIAFFVFMGIVLNFGSYIVYVIAIACETVAYFIIWIINYLKCKRAVRDMNGELAAFKKQTE